MPAIEHQVPSYGTTALLPSVGSAGRLARVSGGLYMDNSTAWVSVGGAVGVGDGVLNVKDYGAVGDGVAFDTLAIQAALDAVGTSASVVYFPPGTYLTSATLTLSTDRTVVRGAGRGSIIQASSNYTIISGTSRSDIVIEDLTVDGQQAGGVSTATGIFFTGAASQRIHIRNNWVLNSRYSGIRINDGPSQVWIENNFIGTPAGHGVHIGDASDIRIIGNVISSAGNTTVAASDRGKGIAIEALTTNCDRIDIVGNQIQQSRTIPIELFTNDAALRRARWVMIADNRTERTAPDATLAQQQISVDGAQFVTVANNITRGGTGGIEVIISDFVDVVGNIVDSPSTGGGYGIRVLGFGSGVTSASGVTVSGNVVRNCVGSTANGISFGADAGTVTDFVCVGNVCLNNGLNGIDVSTRASRGRISGNYSFGSAGTDLVVAAARANLVSIEANSAGSINVDGTGYDVPARIANTTQTEIMESYAAPGRNIIWGRVARGNSTAPTAVTAGDRLLEVYGAGFAGTEFLFPTGGMSVLVESGTISSASMPTGVRFETTPDGSTSRLERMRIAGSGGVGIGTTAPGSGLQIGTTGSTHMLTLAPTTQRSTSVGTTGAAAAPPATPEVYLKIRAPNAAGTLTTLYVPAYPSTG